MDGRVQKLHFSGMQHADAPIPAFGLYGDQGLFPDLLHCERIIDRAGRHDWRISPHRHGVLHQFFLLDGPGAEVTLDGAARTIGAATLLSVPRFCVHWFRFPAGQRGHVLSVLPDTLPDLFGPDAAHPGALSRPLSCGATDDVRAAFASIRAELTGNLPLRDALLKARVVEIAATLLRATEAEGDPPGDRRAVRIMRKFEAALRAADPARPRIEEVAARIGVSSEHLGRVCRRLTGLSPGRFAEDRVMAEARRQLAYTRQPISGIARSLGFDDPAYFSRAFRRHAGETPRDYRARRAETS